MLVDISYVNKRCEDNQSMQAVGMSRERLAFEGLVVNY